MKTKLALALLLALPGVLVLAQTVPRQKPIPPRVTPTLAPTPTPTPLPANPNGLYVGDVEGSSAGTRYSFGRWTFSLLSIRCDDCDPGQFDVDGSTYTGMTYTRGPVEQGTVFGFVNPSGKIVAFALLATNCEALNSSRPIPATAGYYQGGSFGELPGTTLRVGHIDPGFGLPLVTTLSGRVSGRDCFNQLIEADITLTRQ